MFGNNLVVAFRVMRKQKAYAIINIAGLAIGMACCVLVISFILTELSFDRYHENADRIYRVISKLILGKTPNMIATTNVPPALAMRDDYPEVIDALRLRPLNRVPVRHEDTEFYEERIFYADGSIFDIFTFPMINGDPKSALTAAYSLVLSETTARRFFGDSDPIGKALKVNNQTEYTVTGVVKDVPENSHFIFDILLSFESLIDMNPRTESWSTPFGFHSYILLDPNANYKEVEARLPALVEKYIGDSFQSFGASVEYYLQPLTDIHLRSKLRHEISVHSDIRYVYIFGFVALFVLLIACFNFMNLSTARSATRADEVGMRKILGAERKRLIARFLGESLAYSFLALIIAMVIVQLALPVFRTLSNRPLTLDFGEIAWLLPGGIGLAIVVGLIAGIYPAFFLSSFQPIRVLKGSLKTASTGAPFRRILVILQFTISIGLIICTSIVFEQLQYMRYKNLGFDKEHVIVVPLVDNTVRQSLDTLKEKLQAYPGVVSVASSSHVPGGRPSGGSYRPEGYAEGETVMMDGMTIDHDYVPTMGVEIVAGRNFSEDHPLDPQESILINESAVAEIGWRDAIGKKIKTSRQPEGKTVIGVVRDFHFQSPHKSIRGVYYSNDPANFFPHRAMFIKTAPGTIARTLDQLRREWNALGLNRTLDLYFLDAAYDKQYRAEERLSQIFTYFTLLAIFIACLGLFGMSSFSAEQRTKEIGIRKVLGAPVANILFLLSRNFLWTVIVSFAIAAPIAYFAMHRWLQDFQYRMDIQLGSFLLAGVLALLVAILTVSLQSIRAALANPVETLRYE